jgi:hypothetical protein
VKRVAGKWMVRGNGFGVCLKTKIVMVAGFYAGAPFSPK